jgi:uncharacterized protein YdeI (YjbR/CyaY-like superfamily)
MKNSLQKVARKILIKVVNLKKNNMTHPSVDAFLDGLSNWKAELTKLRQLGLECHLEEGFKWKHPCYMFESKNIFLIHGFKDYCAILFMKGSLLSDSHRLLHQQTDHVQSGRQIRFTSVKEIEAIEQELKQYIYEAIEVERAGLKVVMKAHDEYEVVPEFEVKLAEDQGLKTAFYALTPGRQRGYLLHFSNAKQSSTRLNRIEQVRSRILKGKGMTDCICGLSKRMPNCDGSHKFI